MSPKNPVRLDGETAVLTLTQGREVRIDAADLPLVASYRWYAARRPWGGGWRVVTTVRRTDGPGRRGLTLPRLLLAPPPTVVVRPLNGDGLDCRRANLVAGGQPRSRPPTPLRVDGEVAYLLLDSGREAVIDAADAPLVAGRHWFLRWNKRARAHYVTTHWPLADGRATTRTLQRVVMDPSARALVAFRTPDTLDCRRANLLVVSDRGGPAEGERRAQRNSKTGVRGVSYVAARDRYVARVERGGRMRQRVFPATPEGLAAAAEAVRELRQALAEREGCDDR